MSKYDRDHFEQWCEANNIETGRTVCVFEAWAKLQSERDELLAMLVFCKSALEHCYDVVEWPANGSSQCDLAISKAKRVIDKVGAK
jgi:hypothetical protein